MVACMGCVYGGGVEAQKCDPILTLTKGQRVGIIPSTSNKGPS